MENKISGAELLNIAVRIENNGYAFYDQFAKKAKDNAVNAMLIYLRDEEKKHSDKFSYMLEELHKKAGQESLYTQEYSAYIKSIASKLVFSQENTGIEIAQEMKSDKQAIEKAIEFEKDSIRYYNAMKEAVSEGEKNVLEEVVHEEEVHLEKLSGLLAGLENAGGV